MKRNVTLAEISDGRLYGSNDMVKADCHGCRGCHSCCTGMGNSVLLDPYDVYRLQQGVGMGLSGLFAGGMVELNVVDGVTLPNLKMAGEEERCVFLDREGWCSIHASRPGLCRLFPLGRYYENGDFRYFLQVGECGEKNRSKIKVCKWIDTPDEKRNHDFICEWHTLLKWMEEEITMGGAGTEAGAGRCAGEAEKAGMEKREVDVETGKRLNLLMLKLFFLEPYDVERDFYDQFAQRMARFKEERQGFCSV